MLVAFDARDDHRIDKTLFGEAQVSPRHMLVIHGEDKQRFKAIRDYFFELLRELEITLPKHRAGMVELIEPR